jgi:uncharacterized protein DUF5753
MLVTPFSEEIAGGGVEDVRGAHTLDRYQATARFAVYEPLVIPGPLQHPDYAAAVQAFWARHLKPGSSPVQRAISVAEALEGHRRRAELALAATSLDVIIEEAALSMAIGGPGVLATQLQDLLELIRDRRSLNVAVIPAGRPREVPPLAGFWILDGELATCEVGSASLTEAEPIEVEAYERHFAWLREVALDGYAARRLIMDAREKAASLWLMS